MGVHWVNEAKWHTHLGDSISELNQLFRESYSASSFSGICSTSPWYPPPLPHLLFPLLLILQHFLDAMHKTKMHWM